VHEKNEMSRKTHIQILHFLFNFETIRCQTVLAMLFSPSSCEN